MHLNLTVFAGYDSDSIVKNALGALLALRSQLGNHTQVGLVARSDYSLVSRAWALECRRQGAKTDIPVFDELSQAAETFGHYRRFFNFRRHRQTQSIRRGAA